MKELHLTEGRGTGIPTVIHAMRENGSPLPTFDTDEGRTYFTATLPVHPPSNPPSTRAVTHTVTHTVDRKVGNSKTQILLVYCISPRDRASIQARLGLRNKNDALKRYIAPATAAGWLTMTDPLYPNSPTQKYRTTPEGLAVLDAEDDGEQEQKIQPELVFLNPPYS